MILDSIRSPSDVKNLSAAELQQLADEVRQRLIAVVSQTGGHIGAGLGVVELTVALCAAFDSPRDKIVWDVGHQGYPWKILTGRNARLPTLRQEGQTVFRWAVWDMAKVAKQALDAAGVTSADLSAFIPHQANMRIIDEFAKQLKLPDSVVIARDIATTGNTSAASIPLATHRLLEEHPELSGGLALQIGFGAGLVFGAQVVVLP